jgi:hypothetical protein
MTIVVLYEQSQLSTDVYRRDSAVHRVSKCMGLFYRRAVVKIKAKVSHAGNNVACWLCGNPWFPITRFLNRKSIVTP